MTPKASTSTITALISGFAMKNTASCGEISAATPYTTTRNTIIRIRYAVGFVMG
jgi:hypothetical protein